MEARVRVSSPMGLEVWARVAHASRSAGSRDRRLQFQTGRPRRSADVRLACGAFVESLQGDETLKRLLYAGADAAREIALGKGLAVAVARHVDGVVDLGRASGGVAHGIEAGDGVAVLVPLD